ncbi:MAG: asparagine synthase (glutamine-hydrolyzing) [Clostridia bacterium]|nr:asparagine synthase (glutamine-hydrolyzing) [Clostridia bacterium]MBR5044244.1 asparagine synthase (glutamine-hydrolyzing) [Clostridia bacterium]
MCSICGLFAPRRITPEKVETVRRMGETMRPRGPDRSGGYADLDVAFHHNRLAVMDPERGDQPMTVRYGRRAYTVVYNGELYNGDELRRELSARGVRLRTRCDTELLVYAYAVWGEACLSRLNGIYAFAVWDRAEEKLFCARDPLGVKPFWYATPEGEFCFASEVKALLRHPSIKPRIGREGLWQLLYLTPVTLRSVPIFEGVFELCPGECLSVTATGIRRRTHFHLSAAPFSESREECIAHTRELVTDAIRRQTESDVPLACFLSGGLDSTVVAGVAAGAFRERGETLSTYSFEYEDNEYAPTLFQPNRDDDYARLAARAFGTDHTVLVAPNGEVADLLFPATAARDLPGQADIDSSLLYFCREVRRRHTVALSGECADEIFGGYPWFYRPEMLARDFFPWIHDPAARISLFRRERVLPDEGLAYLSEQYRAIVASVDCLEEDSPEMKQSRIASVLSQSYFMQSLLERKDRMSMANGLEVRVPFSDQRIASYLYNVPWAYKYENGVEKSLLREAMHDVLPDEIYRRKKSPYPKTHSRRYEAAVLGMLKERLARPNSPLAEMADPAKLRALLDGGKDATWFGQLMARPQLLAWLCQFDWFCETYRVEWI